MNDHESAKPNGFELKHLYATQIGKESKFFLATSDLIMYLGIKSRF